VTGEHWETARLALERGPSALDDETVHDPDGWRPVAYCRVDLLAAVLILAEVLGRPSARVLLFRREADRWIPFEQADDHWDQVPDSPAGEQSSALIWLGYQGLEQDDDAGITLVWGHVTGDVIAVRAAGTATACQAGPSGAFVLVHTAPAPWFKPPGRPLTLEGLTPSGEVAVTEAIHPRGPIR
jgi:hypothetical protein